MSAPLTVQLVGQRYSTAPLPRSHGPPPVYGTGGYAGYRSCLRVDFNFRCAYCLAHEREVGPSEDYGGFEIEHFKPQGLRQFRKFANTYSNLLWACPTCNRAKHHTWPDAAELALGMRFVDPSVEALGDYLSMSGNLVVGTLDPKRASAAEYMIDAIRLNRAAHKERRQRRKDIAVKVATMEAMLEVFREDVAALTTPDQAKLDEISRAESELKRFADMLGATPPFDAPASCLCPTPGATTAKPAKQRRGTRRARKKNKKSAAK